MLSGRGITATSPLLEACLRDKPLVIKACIKAGAKPTKPCNRYSLSAASKTKNKSTAKYLIDEAGFKYFVNRHKPKGPDREKGWFAPYLYQPLLYAVINEWKDIFEEILDAHPQSINFMDLRNQTPISVAAEHGLLDMVKYLVELGADPHSLDSGLYVVFEEDFIPLDQSWWTKWGPSHPLAEAAASGHLDVVKYLVELGADSRVAVTHSERESQGEIFTFRSSILHDVPAIELAEKFNQPHVVEFLRDIEKDLPVKRPPETW
jgi:ankyrin repeat protein